MKFQVGQKVVFLREQGGGIIRAAEGNGKYRVEDNDGFIRFMHEYQLALLHGEREVPPSKTSEPYTEKGPSRSVSGSFVPGQKVVFLREQGGGVILSAEPKGMFRVEDNDGFRRLVHRTELGPVHGDHQEVTLPDMEIREKDLPTKKKPSPKLPPIIEKWHIDLHIEELVESHTGWGNAQILSCQMRAFEAFFNKARRNRIRLLIVIHGVGEGVLRHEVRTWLDKQGGVEYYDADYRKYGMGATCVELRYS